MLQPGLQLARVQGHQHIEAGPLSLVASAVQILALAICNV